MRTTHHALILLSFAACATDPETSAVDVIESVTPGNACAVNSAQNATAATSPSHYDGYTRSAATINGSGAGQCNCRAWQEIYDEYRSMGDNDAQAAAIATSSIGTCRPETSVEFTVTTTTITGVQFHASTDFGDKLETPAGCTASNLHMEVWRYVSGTTWDLVWGGTGIGQWTPGFGRCGRIVGDSSPLVGNGRYRVKATANVAGEQGYGEVEIYAGPHPAPH